MNKAYKISEFVRIKDQVIFSSSGIIFNSEENSNSNDLLKEAYTHLKVSYPKFHKMDELCKLGILATEVLFQERIISPDTALVFSNKSSSLQSDLKHRKLMEETVSPATFVYTLPNIVSGEISIKYNLHSENAFFISENFDAELLYDYSQGLLNLEEIPAVVCGWIEVNNAEYDVFLCLISTEGKTVFSVENLEALYNFDNE